MCVGEYLIASRKGAKFAKGMKRNCMAQSRKEVAKEKLKTRFTERSALAQVMNSKKYSLRYEVLNFETEKILSIALCPAHYCLCIFLASFAP